MNTIKKVALIGGIGIAAVTSFAHNGDSGSDTPYKPVPVYTPSPTSYGSYYKGTYRLDNKGNRVPNDCYAWARSLDNPSHATQFDIEFADYLCETWPK